MSNLPFDFEPIETGHPLQDGKYTAYITGYAGYVSQQGHNMLLINLAVEEEPTAVVPPMRFCVDPDSRGRQIMSDAFSRAFGGGIKITGQKDCPALGVRFEAELFTNNEGYPQWRIS